MFKIESYITNIILANADRYIKNFRKQDAQVSLWEGDATFHNIELNIDALNEEFELPFLFTSGYIHDLVIHVPWTKLTSEHVTIHINTIECVVKLKSIENCKTEATKSFVDFARYNEEKYANKHGNIPPPNSYISSLTNRIMNNLSIQCKNFILKLVEEDIVLSMNIEKLVLFNVNENWEQAFTEMNTEYLLSRKSIDLLGVTICLDQQNSSGRIETYLEPLLYRCQVIIRIYRSYASLMSKKPSFTNINIFSSKMNFTFSEPQIPMLLRLLSLVLMDEQKETFDHLDSADGDDNKSQPSIGCIDFSSNISSDINDEPSWGVWLWSMVPSLLPQEDDDTTKLNETKMVATLNIGFYIKDLEMILKFADTRIKKNSRADYIPIMKSTFTGCLVQIMSKNSEWLNIQLGTSSINIQPVYESSSTCNEQLSQKPFIISGNEGMTDYLKGTLFDNEITKCRRKGSLEEFGECQEKVQIDSETNEDTFRFSDIGNNEFCSLDDHLSIYTENALLDRTPAFSMDYLKYYTVKKSSINNDTGNNIEDSNDDGRDKIDLRCETIQKQILTRFVFGPTIVRMTLSIMNRLLLIYKLLTACDCFSKSSYQQNIQCNRNISHTDAKFEALPYHIKQYTFFDINFEIYPAVPATFSAFRFSSDVFPSTSSLEDSVFLRISLKCLDAKVVHSSSHLATFGHCSQQTISFKAIGSNCCINFTKFNGGNSSQLFMIKELECCHNINSPIYFQNVQETCFEINNIKLAASKTSFLLSYYICKSSFDSFYQINFPSSIHSNIWSTTLLEDVQSEPGGIVLDLNINNIIARYKSKIGMKVIKVSVDNCSAFINKLGVNSNILSVPILTCSNPKLETFPCIQVMIQNTTELLEGESTSFPQCVYMNVNSLCFNFDPLMYSFISYNPVKKKLQRIKQKTKSDNFSKEYTSSRSVPNRKISDSSNSSYSKRIGMMLPKPKESVHNSLEQEPTDPQTADTVTDSLDYHTIHSVPETSSFEQSHPLFTQWLLKLYDSWNYSIVFGEISQLCIYVPSCSLATSIRSPQNIRLDIKDIFQKKLENNIANGSLNISLKSIRLKCDVSSQILEDLCLSIPVTLPNNIWTPGKSSFPWALEVTDLYCNTFTGEIDMPLLKPFSANCTVSFSLRDCETDKSSVALYIHVDIQPVIICLNSTQVSLIINIAEKCKSVLENQIDFIRSDINETVNIEKTTSSIKTQQSGNTLDNRKVTGWIQCTVTKFSFILYDQPTCSNEQESKLVLEIEDSILSLEYDNVYHKIKLKLATFNMYHYSRCFKNEIWTKGPFSGIVIKRRTSEFQSRCTSPSDENPDRFLLATITRARSSNLHSKLFLKNRSASSVPTTRILDPYISEVILNICPMDIVLPMLVLHKYVSIIIPLVSFVSSYKTNHYGPAETCRDMAPSSSISMPLIYIDTHNLRLFVPTDNTNDAEALPYDTIILEICSIHADCHPDYPISRKPIQPNLYFATTNKRVSSVHFPENEDRQYQLQLKDIVINTGIWSELESTIDEQFTPLSSLPIIFQQNPAVMWNQGHHPEESNRIYLKYLSPVTKFSCNVLIAPAVVCQSTKSVICCTSYEVSFSSHVNVQFSLSQLILATTICQESFIYLSYLKASNNDLLLDKKQDLHSCSSRSSILYSIHDSGIESGTPSSSSGQKNNGCRSRLHVPNVHNQKSRSLTNISSNYNENNNHIQINDRQPTSTTEIFISAPSISAILYTVSKSTNFAENSNLIFSGLLYALFSQPHLLLNLGNRISNYQVSFFNANVKFPLYDNAENLHKIPTENNFKLLFMETKKSNRDEFTGIPDSSLTADVKYGIANSCHVNIALGQPIYIMFTPTVLDYLENNVNTFFRRYGEHMKKSLHDDVDVYNKVIKHDTVVEYKFINVLRSQSRITPEITFCTKQIILGFVSDAEDQIAAIWTSHSISVNISANGKPDYNPEVITLSSSLEAITLAVLQVPNNRMELFKERTISNINLSSNVVLKPLNVEYKLTFDWTKKFQNQTNFVCYANIKASDIVADITPTNLAYFSDILYEYEKWTTPNRSSRDQSPAKFPDKDSVPDEIYKDDLRAGAFQSIKVTDDKWSLPSAYEVVFCNRIGNPYVCWTYPQPRTITKLQMYPVTIENSEHSNEGAECELQYFDETTQDFIKYSVVFTLPKDNLCNIPLPTSQPDIQVSTCWRIVLHCPIFAENTNQTIHNYVDISSLGGCIRIDSLYSSSLVPHFQISFEISAIQVNLCVLYNSGDTSMMFDQYRICNMPTEHNIITIKSQKCISNITHRDQEMVIKINSVLRLNVLNYEYLMFQPFVDPFTAFIVISKISGIETQLFAIIGHINVRFSQNLLHSLSVSHSLWYNSIKADSSALFKVTAPYIICNNTNYVITISQESTDEEILLQPGWCHLYAWFTPFVAKRLKITVFCDRWKLKTVLTNIRKISKDAVTCVSEDGVTCNLFISIKKFSPVVHQILIEGHFIIYNQTDSEMEIFTTGISSKNKSHPVSNCLEYQMSSIVTIAGKKISSIIIPSKYDISLKIRHKCSDISDISYWSGIIPVKLLSPNTNDNRSWLVKLPLKGSKDHFQSIWCDVIQEVVNGFSRLLVIFKPLCILQSYLPWQTYLKVLDEKGTIVSNIIVGDKGAVQDLFIPDTISLDNFCIQWHQREEVQNTVSLTLVKPFSKPDLRCPVPNIDNLIEQIDSEKQFIKWPFADVDVPQLKWSAFDNCNITPHFNIFHKQQIGIGLFIEISPWAMFLNTLGCQIHLDINGDLYPINHYSVCAPPLIEDNFELKLFDASSYYSSGSLRLLQDQKLTLPKEVIGIPFQGFVSSVIDCHNYVTFLNIKSTNVNNIRIINICASYIITNCTSWIVKYSAFAVCRTNNASNCLIDLPENIENTSQSLLSDKNYGQSIIKWEKIGKNETHSLPYLIIVINGYVSGPVRICDLSEKYAVPLLFSSSESLCSYPSINITAQHKEGQVFITLWDELVPQITIHNKSKLSLSVVSSKTEHGSQIMYDCIDWNWKFHCCPNTIANYRIQNMCNSQDKSNRHLPYLLFSVNNSNYVKDIKWSKGIALQPCRNQQVTLPLSQRHITVSIFKNGFTKIILIETAFLNNLAITSLQARLLQTHFDSEIDGVNFLHENEDPCNVEQENSDSEIPGSIKDYYASDCSRTFDIMACVEGFSIGLVSIDDGNNDDVATFNIDDITIVTKNLKIPHEIQDEKLLKITVSSYQFDNEEHRYRTYDFPVILINKPTQECSSKCIYQHPSVDNINEIIKLTEKHSQAMDITINGIQSKMSQFNVRDISIKLSPQYAYIEDKYVFRLKALSESIVSSIFQNNINIFIIKDENILRNTIQILKEQSNNLVTNEEIVKRNSLSAIKGLSASSKSVNVSESETDGIEINQTVTLESNRENKIENLSSDNIQQNLITRNRRISLKRKLSPVEKYRDANCIPIPENMMKLSENIAKPVRFRLFHISMVNITVSVHTSTSFYIALDHSPVRFSEFKAMYLVTSPYQLGHLLTIHYMMGAIYGSGWAISNLEFVGSPGGLVRTVGTGIKDFVSLPIYGISNGPQGFILGIASGSASLMKHVMAGTLTSVTQFAGSWARTLDRFTLDADDLLQSEVVRRRPPSNITEGILQGLTEFGISLLGAISGIAHHPLQYAVSETADRSLFNSISLGLVGMITRPLSGAAELVARTGQGILSHVGWNTLPQMRQSITDDKLLLFNTILRYKWKITNVPDSSNILLIIDGANAISDKIELITLILTNHMLYVNEAESDIQKYKLSLSAYKFYKCDNDHTLINAVKITENYKDTEGYCHIRIKRFIEDTNNSLGIKTPDICYASSKLILPYKFYINPDVRNFFLTMVNFIKNNAEIASNFTK